MSAFASESRLAPVGRATPADREALTVAERRRVAKAIWHQRLARLGAYGFATGGTLREAREHIQRVLEAEAAERGHAFVPVTLPSARTLRRLIDRWVEGKRGLDAFLPAPRSGRPRVVLADELAGMVDDYVASGGQESIRRLAEDLEDRAEALGVPAPARTTVLRRLGERQLERVAARHGRRAAEMDAMPHLTVPVDHVHDVWTLDELTLPAWSCQYDRQLEEWVAVRLSLVLIVDNKSRVVVAYFLCDAGWRTDATGVRVQSGFDQDDVLAALLSAGVRELAPPACAAYAGHLPKVLRWDNASPHRSLARGRPESGRAATTLPLEHLLTIHRLPRQRPINRGVIEAAVDTIKQGLAGIHGHVATCTPVERARRMPEAERTVAAGAGRRSTRTVFVEPLDLYRAPEIATLVDAAVRRYNERQVHSGLGTTPAAAFRQFRAADPRTGRDLIKVLPPQTRPVGPGKLVVERDGQRHQFAAATDVAYLKPNVPLTFRVDPRLRVLFAEVGNRTEILRTLDAEARRTDPTDFARGQRTLAAVASGRGAAALTDHASRAIGALVLGRARRAAERLLAADGGPRPEAMHGGHVADGDAARRRGATRDRADGTPPDGGPGGAVPEEAGVFDLDSPEGRINLEILRNTAPEPVAPDPAPSTAAAPNGPWRPPAGGIRSRVRARAFTPAPTPPAPDVTPPAPPDAVPDPAPRPAAP